MFFNLFETFGRLHCKILKDGSTNKGHSFIHTFIEIEPIHAPLRKHKSIHHLASAGKTEKLFPRIFFVLNNFHARAVIYAIAGGTWVAGIYCKNLFIEIISLRFLVHDFVRSRDHFKVKVFLLAKWKYWIILQLHKQKSVKSSGKVVHGEVTIL